MRPLEFRVWHKPTMQMYYVHSIVFAQGIIFALPPNGAIQISQVLKLDDCALMQFTGVLDAEGTKIWEGDILYWSFTDEEEPDNNDEAYCEVMFLNGTFGTDGDHFNPIDSLSNSNGVIAGGNHDMVVRGNVHQHGYLLTQAKNVHELETA